MRNFISRAQEYLKRKLSTERMIKSSKRNRQVLSTFCGKTCSVVNLSIKATRTIVFSISQSKDVLVTTLKTKTTKMFKYVSHQSHIVDHSFPTPLQVIAFVALFAAVVMAAPSAQPGWVAPVATSYSSGIVRPYSSYYGGYPSAYSAYEWPSTYGRSVYPYAYNSYW